MYGGLSYTGNYIYKGCFLKTPGVPRSSRLGLDSMAGLKLGMGLCVCMKASVTQEII